MSSYKMGFLGAGNMGGALATAACRSLGGDQVIVADISASRADGLAAQLGCRSGTTEAVISSSDYVFLGVKPQMMQQLLEDIAPRLQAQPKCPVLVSMAAGLSMERLTAMAGFSCPIIRIMPNTPVSVGQGMILYDCNDLVGQDDIAGFLEGLAQAGRLDRLAEQLIDAGSSVSGCGPGFVDLFLEALADGGVACGLPRDKALLYAEQTVLGAATLALESGTHPGALKDMVCSPGGSTIQGVRALEQGGLRSAVMEAVIAAFEKTLDLGR